MLGFNATIFAASSKPANTDRAGVGHRRRWYSPVAGTSSTSSISSESSPLEVDTVICKLTQGISQNASSSPLPNYGSLQHRYNHHYTHTTSSTTTASSTTTILKSQPGSGPFSWRWWRSFNCDYQHKRHSLDPTTTTSSSTTSASSVHPLYCLLPGSIMPPPSTDLYHHSLQPPFYRSWKCLCAILLLAFSIVYHNHSASGNNGDHNNGHRPYSAPFAKWDHNVYVQHHLTTSSAQQKLLQNENFFLIAQLAGSSLQSLTDITSRPNRAYARQHGMDYVRYSRGNGGGFLMNWGRRSSHHQQHTPIKESKTCFDKVILLNTILDKQLRNMHNVADHAAVMALFSLPPEVQYKAVALLPPDAIVTDLDCHLFDVLLPRDKLVAIAGFQQDDNRQHTYTYTKTRTSTIVSSKTDILLFNLEHPRANAVAKMWWDLVEPSEVTCGAGNDLTLLVDAISLLLEDGEELSSVIASLEETMDGFVSLGGPPENDRDAEGNSNGKQQQEQQPQLIKAIVPAIPQSRAHMLLSNMDSARVQLQTTADSVCYRYYPRCEVLLE